MLFAQSRRFNYLNICYICQLELFFLLFSQLYKVTNKVTNSAQILYFYRIYIVFLVYEMVCKTLIHQFKSGRHLQKIPGSFGCRDFFLRRPLPAARLLTVHPFLCLLNNVRYNVCSLFIFSQGSKATESCAFLRTISSLFKTPMYHRGLLNSQPLPEQNRSRI